MNNRWIMLAVLFAVRATMAFQFQSVAAVAPNLARDLSINIADVGVLIGLYFTPGLVLALPGGAIGRKIGDKSSVVIALLLMLAGGLIMTASLTWSGQVAGRLVAGTGGVLLNVQMTKMVTDWFAGREISTALAIFVNSWPAGVALSLLILPPISAAYGIIAVYLTVLALIAAGTALLAAVYRSPPPTGVSQAAQESLSRSAWLAIALAGSIWALFNVGFAMIFSFAPTMLTEKGWSVAAAGSAVSVVLWLSVLSVPAGGLVADRTGRPSLILVVGSIGLAILLLVLSRTDAVIAIAVAIGLVSGWPAGPIMSLPARVLTPATRAIGMGLFYTIYYGGMMLGAMIGGAVAKSAGSAAAALDFGAATVLLCPLMLWLFERLRRTG